MKISEMNAHQRAIYYIMDEVTREYIGGLENTLLDCEEDTEAYKSAYEFLHQGHEQLAEFFYKVVMDECRVGTNASHARFAGSKFLRERIERRLAKWGY